MQGPTDRVPMSVSYCFREIEFHILLLNNYAYVNKKSFSGYCFRPAILWL
jgi:hypothetical protein